MAREIRTTAQDGVMVAGKRTLTVRSPMVVGVFCNRQGAPNGDLHTEGGQARLDTVEVAGIAIRTSTTWTYRNAVWSYLNGNDNNSSRDCADNGADTAWAASEFHRIRRLNLLFSPSPNEGDVVMLFRETTYKIQTSVLDPTTLGLFRRSYGGAFIEFATGIDTTAQFQYRTTGSTYADTISGSGLANINAVRLVADARRPAPTGGQDAITFGWSVNVALRNVR